MRFKHLLLVLAILTFVSSHAIASNSETYAEEAIQRGNELVAKARFEQAIKEYEHVAPNAGETYSIALYNIGVCHYELWQTDRAVSFYRLAIERRRGSYPRAWYALGVALEELGQLVEAESAYEQALVTSRGKYPLASYRLGVLASNKDFAIASEFFRKALMYSGEHVPASHNNLGVMLARMGRFKEAEKEFVIALRQTHGEFPDATYNLKLCRRFLERASDVTAVTLRVSSASRIIGKEN